MRLPAMVGDNNGSQLRWEVEYRVPSVTRQENRRGTFPRQQSQPALVPIRPPPFRLLEFDRGDADPQAVWVDQDSPMASQCREESGMRWS
jgi:hypothetical protein